MKRHRERKRDPLEISGIPKKVVSTTTMTTVTATATATAALQPTLSYSVRIFRFANRSSSIDMYNPYGISINQLFFPVTYLAYNLVSFWLFLAPSLLLSLSLSVFLSLLLPLDSLLWPMSSHKRIGCGISSFGNQGKEMKDNSKINIVNKFSINLYNIQNKYKLK